MFKRSDQYVTACVFAITSFLWGALPLTANVITFHGSFQHDDDIAIFNITVQQPASVEIRSVGYAGDPRSDIGTIPSGGFDSYLTLFDPSGAFIVENDDGSDAAIDPTTGQGFDAYISQELLPGSYELALTQSGNYGLGPNVRDGFSQTGNPYYTSDPAFVPGYPCPGDLFKDGSLTAGHCRSANYWLEFASDNATAFYSEVAAPPSVSPTPEPKTLYLSCVGVVLLTANLARKRVKASR